MIFAFIYNMGILISHSHTLSLHIDHPISENNEALPTSNKVGF